MSSSNVCKKHCSCYYGGHFDCHDCGKKRNPNRVDVLSFVRRHISSK